MEEKIVLTASEVKDALEDYLEKIGMTLLSVSDPNDVDCVVIKERKSTASNEVAAKDHDGRRVTYG